MKKEGVLNKKKEFKQKKGKNHIENIVYTTSSSIKVKSCLRVEEIDERGEKDMIIDLSLLLIWEMRSAWCVVRSA